MSTMIMITDAPAQLRLGVSAGERARPQTVLVSFSLELGAAPASDTLAASVDYDALIGFVRDRLDAEGPFQLIETVADRCAAFALSLSDAVAWVSVTVKKPSVLAAPGMVSAMVMRMRDGEAP